MLLVKYQLASLRDVISAMMTAKARSQQSIQGALHFVFYSKSKVAFIANIVKLFESLDIDILPYKEAQLRAIASAGGTYTASIMLARKPQIYSKS